MTTTFDTATVPQNPEFGLYGRPWGKLLAPNVRHPAKFSLNLVRWIFQHGIDAGYWRKGDTILDPFCGVSMGGVIAPEFGLRWTGVELEPTFVQMSRDNFAHQFDSGNPAWKNLRAEDMPVVYQGDSRNLRQILSAVDVGHPLCVVTSPAYGNRLDDHGTDKPGYDIVEKMGDYGPMGAEEGQIGVMRAGGGMTSPPYSHDGSPSLGSVSKDDWGHTGKDIVARRGLDRGYGTTEGQINLGGSVSSPPFTPSDPRDRNPVQPGVMSDVIRRAYTTDSVGLVEGNIGNLPGMVTTSKKVESESYWDACAQVYRELYETLQPGSVCAIVVKDFVKDFKRVPLCDMTLELLVSLGYIPLEQTLAMLWDIKSDGSRVERKSFFRRNAEKKGAPPIDWECVLWVGRL
jgi:hypothetical protein